MLTACASLVVLLSLWANPSFGFLVNTYTPGYQNIGDVAVDDAGNFVVVWTSEEQDGDGDGVFAQRYDSGGAPVGTEFRVNPNTADDQRWPRVSKAPNGGFVVVWTDRGELPPDTSMGAIRAQRFDSLGAPTGTAFAVNTYTTGTQSWPTVAHDGTGNFIIAWTSSAGQDGDGAGVFAQLYDSSGIASGSEFQVNTYTTGSQSANQPPAIAAAPDGTITIAWYSQAQDDGDIGIVGGGVYAQRYDSTGNPLGSEFQVNISTAGGQGGHGIDMATDSAGNVVIAWSDNNEGPSFLVPGGNVTARRFDSLGAPVGDEFTVNKRIRRGQYNPQVAMDGAGTFLITYNKNGFGGLRALARRFGSDGSPIGAEFSISPSVDGLGVGGVDASPAGHFVAGWGGSDGSDRGVFARRFDTAEPDCPATPRTSCRAAGQRLLLMRSGSSPKLVWKWRRGDAFDEDQLGNPEAGLTDWAFCIYRDDGSPTLIFDARVDAAGTCPIKPCWKSARLGAPYAYQDRTGTGSQGVTKIRLRAGNAKRAAIQLKGAGPSLNLPTLPLGPFDNVTAQFANGNGECWESIHTEASVDSSKTFKAK